MPSSSTCNDGNHLWTPMKSLGTRHVSCANKRTESTANQMGSTIPLTRSWLRAGLLLLLAGVAGCSGSLHNQQPAGPGKPDAGRARIDTGDELAPPQDPADAAREPVDLFSMAFNAHAIDNQADFTTEDWNNINPEGDWTRGRESVLRELRLVHATFLNGVSFTTENMTIRFATVDAAVVTATQSNSAFATPDGVAHEHQRAQITFVVVRRGGRWLLTQTHLTRVGGT
jgi:uncharacterized protein (TIGR02246 family)